MMKMKIVFSLIVAVFSLTGCKSNPDNLVFFDTNQFGARVATASTQGPGLKLGYSSLSYFNVPAVRIDGTGKPRVLTAHRGTDGVNNRDAFSAFGSFNSSTGDSICIGRIAAVGYAARIAAEKARRCVPQ